MGVGSRASLLSTLFGTTPLYTTTTPGLKCTHPFLLRHAMLSSCAGRRPTLQNRLMTAVWLLYPPSTCMHTACASTVAGDDAGRQERLPASLETQRSLRHCTGLSTRRQHDADAVSHTTPGGDAPRMLQATTTTTTAVHTHTHARATQGSCWSQHTV